MTQHTKPQRQLREPVFATDRDNKAIVLVPLHKKKQPAKLFKDDFQRLMQCGYPDQWLLNKAGPGRAYVRVRSARVAGRLELVARLITGAGKGQVVRYMDGDKLNLRRDNLAIKEGAARGQTYVRPKGER